MHARIECVDVVVDDGKRPKTKAYGKRLSIVINYSMQRSQPKTQWVQGDVESVRDRHTMKDTLDTKPASIIPHIYKTMFTC